MNTNPDDLLAAVNGLASQYNLPMNTGDNLGLLWTDELGQTVRVCAATVSGLTFHTAFPHADIAILVSGRMPVGWVESYRMNDAGDRAVVQRGNLKPMPSSFKFIQTCQHMEVHGGFMDGNSWNCFGCSEVFPILL